MFILMLYGHDVRGLWPRCRKPVKRFTEGENPVIVISYMVQMKKKKLQRICHLAEKHLALKYFEVITY